MAKKKSYLGLGLAAAAGLGLYFWMGKAKASSVVAIPPEPKRQPKMRPPGDPPPYGASCRTGAYDAEFWNSKDVIFEGFQTLGYQTPSDRDTMNELGGDKALGGGDDVPNNEVKRFQRDYNKVSRRGEFTPNMKGLDVDGLVGPCTLTGMKYVLDNLGANGNWNQIVAGS